MSQLTESGRASQRTESEKSNLPSQKSESIKKRLRKEVQKKYIGYISSDFISDPTQLIFDPLKGHIQPLNQNRFEHAQTRTYVKNQGQKSFTSFKELESEYVNSLNELYGSNCYRIWDQSMEIATIQCVVSNCDFKIKVRKSKDKVQIQGENRLQHILKSHVKVKCLIKDQFRKQNPKFQTIQPKTEQDKFGEAENPEDEAEPLQQKIDSILKLVSDKGNTIDTDNFQVKTDSQDQKDTDTQSEKTNPKPDTEFSKNQVQEQPEVLEEGVTDQEMSNLKEQKQQFMKRIEETQAKITAYKGKSERIKIAYKNKIQRIQERVEEFEVQNRQDISELQKTKILISKSEGFKDSILAKMKKLKQNIRDQLNV